MHFGEGIQIPLLNRLSLTCQRVSQFEIPGKQLHMWFWSSVEKHRVEILSVIYELYMKLWEWQQYPASGCVCVCGGGHRHTRSKIQRVPRRSREKPSIYMWPRKGGEARNIDWALTGEEEENPGGWFPEPKRRVFQRKVMSNHTEYHSVGWDDTVGISKGRVHGDLWEKHFVESGWQKPGGIELDWVDGEDVWTVLVMKSCQTFCYKRKGEKWVVIGGISGVMHNDSLWASGEA